MKCNESRKDRKQRWKEEDRGFSFSLSCVVSNCTRLREKLEEGEIYIEEEKERAKRRREMRFWKFSLEN